MEMVEFIESFAARSRGFHNAVGSGAKSVWGGNPVRPNTPSTLLEKPLTRRDSIRSKSLYATWNLPTKAHLASEIPMVKTRGWGDLGPAWADIS